MKKTIVMFHGLRGTHNGLDAVAKKLAEKGYNVINSDLPGSGERAELDNKTLDGYAEWLHDFIKKQPQKPYIIGHSMGSIVVSHYLEKYPNDTQDKVVLLSPIFRGKASQRISNVSFVIANGFLHILPKKTRHKFLASKKVSYCISHYLTADKSKQKEIDELHYKYSGRFASANSLIADMKISMRQQTVLPEGKTILCIMGERDRLVKAKTAKARTKNRAKLTTLPKNGHLINYEQPVFLANEIDKFLSSK